MNTAYFFLIIAILCEIIATSALKASDGFSRLFPSILVILGYSSAFYLMSLTLKTLPVGVVYAIWSGLGVVGIAIIGIYYYGEAFTALHALGIAFILAGVLILNLVTGAH